MSAQVTSAATQPGEFSGVEKLDLSVAQPVATPHLSLGDSSGAAFQPAAPGLQNVPSWRISAAGGFMRFQVALPDQEATQQGIVFILELCNALEDNQSDSPINITVNQSAPWVTSFGSPNPLSGNFYFYSWYLPPEMLQVGDNVVSVNLAATATTQVLIRSASLMGVDLQMQQQSNWCWAAVGTSTTLFFDRKNPLTQCSLAGSFLKQIPGFCCNDGNAAGPLCNQTVFLSAVLTSTSTLVSFTEGTLPLQSIRAQINNAVPIAARIGWSGGGGHFVMVTGIGPDDPRGDNFTLVEIEDPSQSDYGSHFVPYATLVSGYRGAGTWTYYYLLKPATEGMKS
jgi:hypothetical protein